MLLLASASPARHSLLEQVGIPHRIQISGFDEALIVEPNPLMLVQRLANAKAEKIMLQLTKDNWPRFGVLGCDSSFIFDGQTFGKPADRDEAISRWLKMSGQWGELVTGHSLSFFQGQDLVHCRATIMTRIKFVDVSHSEIRSYVESGEPLQCAGGFALDGRGGQYIERIEGCYSNVIGLSLPWLRAQLNKLS